MILRVIDFSMNVKDESVKALIQQFYEDQASGNSTLSEEQVDFLLNYMKDQVDQVSEDIYNEYEEYSQSRL